MRLKRKAKRVAANYRHLTRADYADWPNVTIEVDDGVFQDFPDYAGIAIDYAERCVEGKNLVCKWVELAAQRFLDFVGRSKKRGAKFEWSPAHVADVCSFIEKLQHVEGTWDTPTLILEPWQIWTLAAIFGFRRPDGTRLCRWVYLEVPRKSAKSTLLAGISLYGLTCEGENGPAIYIGAPTLEQAGKVFSPATKMVKRDGDLREAFGLKPKAREMECEASQGQIQVITQVGEHQDGHNPHMVMLEELHAQNPGLYSVMRSAFGARKNPLLYQITTAGRVAQGICWDQRKRAQRVLEGTEVADECFGVIYTVDKADMEKLYVERTLIKANPMWGVSVDPEKALEFMAECQNQPSMKAEFLRTRLNVWSNAADRLIQPEAWERCFDPKLKDRKWKPGTKCWLGVDLAARRDMGALLQLIEEDDIVYLFPRFYVPDDAPGFSDPDLIGLYTHWRDEGFLTATGPGMIDFDVVQEDIEAICKNPVWDVSAIAFDPYQAQQLAQNLVKKRLPAVTYANTAMNMTEPTDDLVARIETKTLRHTGHPVLAWHVGNVVGYHDKKGNILPKKEAPNSIYKIDGFHAAVFANGVRITDAKPKEDKTKVRKKVYSQRGLLGAQ